MSGERSFNVAVVGIFGVCINTWLSMCIGLYVLVVRSVINSSRGQLVLIRKPILVTAVRC